MPDGTCQGETENTGLGRRQRPQEAPAGSRAGAGKAGGGRRGSRRLRGPSGPTQAAGGPSQLGTWKCGRLDASPTFHSLGRRAGCRAGTRGCTCWIRRGGQSQESRPGLQPSAGWAGGPPGRGGARVPAAAGTGWGTAGAPGAEAGSRRGQPCLLLLLPGGISCLLPTSAALFVTPGQSLSPLGRVFEKTEQTA